MGSFMKKYILIMVITLIPIVVFAQTVVPDSVYRDIDALLAQPGAPGLGVVLSGHSDKPWYPRLESYVLKRSRQLVIQDNLDQAKIASLAVIDTNLDNVDAVELYQSIQRAIENREKDVRKEEERAALALHKEQATETKVREKVEKTYRALVNPTSGKKVYLDQDSNSQYRTYNWDLLLGLANGSYVSDPVQSSIKYGISGNASVVFRGQDFSAGADVMGEGMILTFSGDEALNWQAGGVIVLASNAVSQYLYLRLGYFMFGFDSGSKKVTETTFNTPVAGISLRDVRFGSSGLFQMGADWYAGHLFEPDITAALGAHIGLTFILAEMDNFDFLLRAGVKDSVFLVDGGMRNDVKVTLSIGVGNYE